MAVPEGTDGGIHDELGRRQVRLAEVQPEHAVHRHGQLTELTDPGIWGRPWSKHFGLPAYTGVDFRKPACGLGHHRVAGRGPRATVIARCRPTGQHRTAPASPTPQEPGVQGTEHGRAQRDGDLLGGDQDARAGPGLVCRDPSPAVGRLATAPLTGQFYLQRGHAAQRDVVLVRRWVSHQLDRTEPPGQRAEGHLSLQASKRCAQAVVDAEAEPEVPVVGASHVEGVRVA